LRRKLIPPCHAMLYHGSRPSGALLHAYIYICLSVLLWVTGLGAEGDGWIDGMEWNGIGLDGT